MRLRRSLWNGVGLTFVGLGLIGVVVPGMPTTVFLILALYCFKRGSKKFEDWLLDHSVFGPTLRDWERTKGIRPRTKRLAVVTLWLFLSVSICLLWGKPWVAATVFACGAWVTWYILSRPDVLDESPLGAPGDVALIEEPEEKVVAPSFGKADAGCREDV